jgi:hypothetical protein
MEVLVHQQRSGGARWMTPLTPGGRRGPRQGGRRRRQARRHGPAVGQVPAARRLALSGTTPAPSSRSWTTCPAGPSATRLGRRPPLTMVIAAAVACDAFFCRCAI